MYLFLLKSENWYGFHCVEARLRDCTNHASFHFGTKMLTNNGCQSLRENSPVAKLLFADPHKIPNIFKFHGAIPPQYKNPGCNTVD